MRARITGTGQTRAGEYPVWGPRSCGIVLSEALGDMEEGSPECDAPEG